MFHVEHSLRGTVATIRTGAGWIPRVQRL